jgi:hydrogenase maturation protease
MTGSLATVVIGLGNVVLSDDGLGVHAVNRLRRRFEPRDGVELVEGGTAGLLLLPYLADSRRVIIVDAIDLGASPGTLVRLRGEDWASAFQVGMTPHDVGLVDLLAAAQLSGAWPEQLVLHGAQVGSTAIGTELTEPLAAAVDPLVDAIAADLAHWGVPIAPSLESAPCA